MTENELLFTLQLQCIPGVGDTTAKKLLQHCGNAEAVFKEKDQNLLKIEGVGTLLLKNLNSTDNRIKADKELQYIQQNNIQYSYFTDLDYPERLKHCLDGPILLFSKGNINIENQKIISVVGTRKITTKGLAFCEKLIEDLAPFNPIIVSGFAYGVDITAHKAAIKNKLQTIGCLAHGLNQIYPKVHHRYVNQVEENGGFFTDFWSSANPERENFLKRNRLIAGLSEATIVVESAEKGGSLVTADIANSYNRDVFAVPGRPADAMSVGCNNLIKQQKAHLMTSAADLIYLLNWELEKSAKSKPIQKQLFVELDETEKRVYRFLKEQEKELLDIIALNCEIPTFKAASILLNMELKGIVRPLPGKLFELV
ncbi:DNA-processing protein DprA [Spongiivirga citrea]|uniref:DNA-protecting protein DprA n=1 Tax=Spongiivirga citrea TaxID=1481457 RepID=A0A6M0CJ93_9FLAO|nr:DNA-processing protein DprA [Spongiivirga citrea]NER17985.1 DNA-protecting protein DprA [Spongiivirga citrea]